MTGMVGRRYKTESPAVREFAMLPQSRVLHGIGACTSLASYVDLFGGEKVMIVTGRTIAGKTQMESQLKQMLGSRWVATFSECEQHVPRASVVQAAELAREHGADTLVSLGGGTPIDTAKGVALALEHDIQSASDFDHHRLEFTYGATEVGEGSEPIDPVPHLSVPTTISGGEYSHGFTVKNEQTGRKDVFIHERYVPAAVILDPELTVHTPGWLWSATGVRAVDHCVEGFLSSASHPLTSALAVSALPMLMESLRHTHTEPQDLQARLTAQIGAWMSIFQAIPNTRFGLSHGLGHQVGGRFDIPHGVTSCILLPHVLRYNAEADEAAGEQAQLARLAGLAIPTASVADAAEALASSVSDLVSDLALPSQLRDYGVPKEAFPLVADDVLSDFIVATNPRPIESADEIVDLLERAW